MKRLKTKMSALFMALTMSVSNVYAFDYQFTASNNGIQTSNNQSYAHESDIRYGAVTKSFLEQGSDGTLTRVEVISGNVFVERYTADYTYIDTKQLPLELPKFGGVHFSDNYNFIVFLQNNTTEYDDREVVRVVRYDKNWNAIDSASLYGENTNTANSSSNVSMTEKNGILYLKTSHRMYVSDDGANHQASMSFALDMTNMQFTEKMTKMSYKENGYVSHSFAEFLTASDNEVFQVDLGDAFPRAIILFRGTKIASGLKYANLFEIPGATGANKTGISLGGIEYTSVTSPSAITLEPETQNNVIVAGRIVQEFNAESHKTDTHERDVFVAVANLNDNGTITGNGIINLTNYKRSDKIKITTPKLVKISDSKLILLWREYIGDETLSNSSTVKYVAIDNNGNKISDIMTATGQLSDVQPVVNGNKVLWYATNGGAPTFYTLDTDTYEVTSNAAVGPTFNYTPIVVQYEPEKPKQDTTTDNGGNTDTGTGTDNGNTGTDSGNSGNTNTGGSNTGDNGSTTGNNTGTTITETKPDFDATIESQLVKSENPTLELTSEVSSVKISGKTAAKLAASGNGLNVVNGNAEIKVTNDAFKSLNFTENDEVEITIEATDVTVPKVVADTDVLNKDLIKESITIGLSINGEVNTELQEAFVVEIDLSKYTFTEEQLMKLTAIEVLPNGKIKHLGGELVDGKFVFRTNKLGDYTVLLSDALVKMEITVGETDYSVNGKENTLDVPPMIINGRTMVPIRFITETLGGEAFWEASSKTVKIVLDENVVTMVIGQTTEDMDVAPVIVNGRTLVPLRYISESFDAQVDWNQDTRSISILR